MDQPRYPFVHADVSADDSEFVAWKFWELGATGVEERDSSTLAHASEGSEVTVVAAFSTEDEARAAMQELHAYQPSLHYLVGDDWRDDWRRFHEPVC
ncbi:MAG: hypothetical protein R3A47_04025 [Polyangiales bacterium]